VGRGVSDGEGVDVFVGNKIGVTVAGGVGEGSRLAVQVGGVTVGGVIRLNPPHANGKKASAEIVIKNFFVIANGNASIA
jgi:hypothetical protein